MADDADFAGDVIEKTKDISVAEVRKQLAGSGQDCCEDCGRDLSPARRKAAPWAIRCVRLAPVFTRKNKHTDAKGKA